ncbi:MAG: flagellar hook-basal body complex protein [Rhodobacteraceae bacterium]|nr:MAG: flagellar hook-basal body complex protein [Paracoccaceae bacterium]
MGISSAMNAGVMGLGVNSSKLATISDNIANSETKGYKRATIEFNSLVLSERPTSYDAGGVRASTVRAIEDQGAIISTRNVMDLAISGRGFLPVADIAEVRRDDPLSMMLTRTGAFRPDFNGYMQTASGLTLLGWQADSNGEFGNVVRDGVSGLSPVRIDSLSLASERTTDIGFKANLRASATVGSTYTIPIEFYNSLGGVSYIDLAFKKVADSNPTVGAGSLWEMALYERPSGDYTGPNRTPNPSEAAERPRSVWRVEFDDQVASGNVGGLKSFERITTDEAGERTYATNPAGDVLVRPGARIPVYRQLTPGDAGYDAGETRYFNLLDGQGGTTWVNTIPPGYTHGATIFSIGGEVLYQAADLTAEPPTYRDMRLAATADPVTAEDFETALLGYAPLAEADGNGTYANGVISLNLTGDNGPIRLNIGRTGTADGLMQIDANYQVLQVTKNGSPASSLVGIEIDETGLLDAIFDTGFRRTLYKIPIGHVQNPNGMRTLDGQAFALTRASGSVYFYDAGSGPTGSLISSALEESTTDIAEELTQLIKTQRAYSSNAKIIQTVDEMLQETTNLKR